MLAACIFTGIVAFAVGLRVGVWWTNRAVLREVDRLFGKHPSKPPVTKKASNVLEQATTKGYRWDGEQDGPP